MITQSNKKTKNVFNEIISQRFDGVLKILDV